MCRNILAFLCWYLSKKINPQLTQALSLRRLALYVGSYFPLITWRKLEITERSGLADNTAMIWEEKAKEGGYGHETTWFPVLARRRAPIHTPVRLPAQPVPTHVCTRDK